ncbi:MAG TPA: hypothetical protein VEC12_08060, partial [Bacteroidia bacterium]|nr:hypothetical protein [Bacteroidia bacterium]
MKKIIVAFSAVCCCFITVYGQDSSSRFSVGIICGPYFKSGADYESSFYYSRGKTRIINLSYGAEFTWYF